MDIKWNGPVTGLNLLQSETKTIINNQRNGGNVSLVAIVEAEKVLF